MLDKIKINYTTLSRFFVVFTGLIKAGYALALLQSIYYYNFPQVDTYLNNIYYKYIAAFFGGNVIAGLFYFKIQRSLVIALSEIIFLVFMIIYSFASTDLCVYTILVAGGIAFIGYPIYAREFFLRNDLTKLFFILWFALGLGICYYFSVRKNYFFIDIDEGFQLESTTPYLFGSISVINIILLLVQKQRETIQFYAQQYSENQDLQNLISIFYQPQHHSTILSEFLQSNNQRNNQQLIQSTESLVEQSQNNNKQFYAILLVGFCAGICDVILQSIPYYFTYGRLYTDDYSQMLEDSFYYFYLLVLIGTTITGCIVLITNIKIKLFTNAFFVVFTETFILIMITPTNYNDTDYTKVFTYLIFVFQFCLIAPMIFFIPFFFLKQHKVILYFLVLWFGTVLNKIFIFHSYKVDEYEQVSHSYNSNILSCIFAFVGVMACHFYIKDI